MVFTSRSRATSRTRCSTACWSPSAVCPTARGRRPAEARVELGEMALADPPQLGLRGLEADRGGVEGLGELDRLRRARLGQARAVATIPELTREALQAPDGRDDRAHRTVGEQPDQGQQEREAEGRGLDRAVAQVRGVGTPQRLLGAL